MNVRIVIVGYGRMGHEVEQQALRLGWPVSQKIDSLAQLRACRLAADELVVEFSQPTAVLDNLRVLSERNAKVVCGTTGWYQHLEEVQSWVEKSDGGLLYGANFSLGVQLFWLLCRQAAQLFNSFDEYDVYLHEVHHRHKLDAPSGTGARSAEIVLAELERKKRIVTELSGGQLAADELHLGSSRGGSEPGLHRLCFDSDGDLLTLQHQARSRAGFAYGALLAGEWLFARQGMYSVDDYLEYRLRQRRL